MFKKSLLCTAIVSMIVTSIAPVAYALDVPYPLTGYMMMPMGKSFTENFTKKAINSKVWGKSYKEYYDSIFAPDYTTISRGKLRLETVENTEGTANAGQLETLRPYYYGTYTVKMKANPARGILSSIRLYNEADPDWANTNEQINLELSSTHPTKVSISNAHAYDNQNDDAYHYQSKIIDVKTIPGLGNYSNKKKNTYKIEWYPGLIRWYINGKKIAEQTKGVPTTPMYINLGSYYMKGWDDFVEPVIEGTGTMLVDSMKYVADKKSHAALFKEEGVEIIGDNGCVSDMNDALQVLEENSQEDYDFVMKYLDIIECVDKGSVMWVWEMPRRHTAGEKNREDEIDLAGALIHEACHSWEFSEYIAKHPDAWEVPSGVYSGKTGEEICLNKQLDFFQKIGATPHYEAYKDAIHTEWWKVDYKDMTY